MDKKTNPNKRKSTSSSLIEEESSASRFQTSSDDTTELNVQFMNLNFKDSSARASINGDDAVSVTSRTFSICSEVPPEASCSAMRKLSFTTYQTHNQKPTEDIQRSPRIPEVSLEEMGVGTFVTEWDSIRQSIKPDLYELLKHAFKSSIKTDIQIRVGGVIYQCHKMVLGCYSKLFANCKTERFYQLPEEKVSHVIFGLIYDWMVVDRPIVKRETLLDLLKASQFLGIPHLFDQCWECVDDNKRFSEDTAFILYVEARHYDMPDVRNLMLTRINLFFFTIAASHEFLTLQANEVCDLLRSNRIGVNTECEVKPDPITKTPLSVLSVVVVGPIVKRETLLDLLKASQFLGIPHLFDQCWECVDDNKRFSEDTAFILYVEARHYDMPDVRNLMLTRINLFFFTIAASHEFLTLQANEVCDLLRSNRIGVNTECEVFYSAVRWLDYEWEARQKHMIEVLDCVRFSLMPPCILVALNRGQQPEEISRLTVNPAVKKKISRGIFSTSSMVFPRGDRECTEEFMAEHDLETPMKREWLYDKNCSYHHGVRCPNVNATYQDFLEYLEMINTCDENYWRDAYIPAEMVECCMQVDEIVCENSKL